MEAFENRDIKDHILKIGDDEWESMCPYFRGVKSKGKPGEVDCNQQPEEADISRLGHIDSCIKDPGMCRLYVHRIKETFPVGTRLRLISMKAEPDMPEGLEGKVEHVDDIGQIHMKWDNGRTLPLVVYLDFFDTIHDENNCTK